MPPPVRAATTDDIPRLVDLLLQDAVEPQDKDAALWRMAEDASAQIETALRYALTAEDQPFRQFWQVADSEGEVTGVIHSAMLPVPPIYAGKHGKPGLILADSFAGEDAPEATVDALLEAAESALRDAGAKIILGSYVVGPDWQESFRRRTYVPLTLYLARTNPGRAGMPPDIRRATEPDIAGIVARSAEHRQVLFDIDPFWEMHPEADARFAAWMTRSLTLGDRDMLVSGPSDRLNGYVIAQPASRLHFPPAHDISATGVIDDFFHSDFADPAHLGNEGAGATALVHAAEAAFAKRHTDAAIVVCPAGWRSKADVLQAAGYETALVWSIKR